MSNLRPDDLVVRCYGHRKKDGAWYGVCVDFNIAVQADSRDELIEKSGDMIKSYLITVYDTDDKASIAKLLRRKAPFKDWLIYYFIKALFFIKNFSDNFTFNQFIPCNITCNN